MELLESRLRFKLGQRRLSVEAEHKPPSRLKVSTKIGTLNMVNLWNSIYSVLIILYIKMVNLWNKIQHNWVCREELVVLEIKESYEKKVSNLRHPSRSILAGEHILMQISLASSFLQLVHI